ncbi:MAG: sugar phosphate nucleotidyltransferase [Gemmatimonadota bacterium]
MIPVAGQATRLASRTGGRPKALLDIGGRPVLIRLLEQLSPAVTDVCLVIGRSGQAVRETFGKRACGARLHYALQTRPAGVADAVGRAGELVRGPFLVVMGDVYYEEPLAPYVEEWRRSGIEGGVLVEPIEPHVAGEVGLVRTRADRVVEIFKAPFDGRAELRVCGMMMFPEAAFAFLRRTGSGQTGEAELEEAVAAMIREGKEFLAVRYRGWRRNINSSDDLEAVRRRLAGRGRAARE